MSCYVWITVGVLIVFILIRFLRRLRIRNYRNKRVFITGCDSGFGYMLARKLDELGFKVYAGCLTEDGRDTIIEHCSNRTTVVPIDVTSDTSIEKAVELVKRSLPEGEGLWAVVNNAGVIGSIGPTGWHTRQDYDNVMAVNLYGVIFVTKAFLPLLIPTKGRVVNMSSTLGRIAIFNPAYTISKYGVEAYSDILRLEMATFGVKVVIIEPGFFNTTLLDDNKYREAVENKLKTLPAEIRQATPDFVVEKIRDGMTFARTKLASNDTYKVVDAYVEAVTARFPKPRYLVGNDVKYFYRVAWSVPEWLSTILLALWMNR